MNDESCEEMQLISGRFGHLATGGWGSMRHRHGPRPSCSLCLGWPDRSRDVSPYFLGHPDRIGPKGVVTMLVEIA